MKKILFIAHDDLTGGSAKALFEQVQYLQCFCEIVVITLKKNSLYYSLKKKNIEVYAARFGFTAIWNTIRIFLPIKWIVYGSWLNFFSYKKIQKTISFSSISLIVSNSSVVNLGAYLHRKTGISHIHFLREYGDDLVPLIRNIGKCISDNADMCIAVSHAVARRWICKGVDPSKIQVVYDGLIVPRNLCCLSNNSDVIKLCMCGRISNFKGQIYAIKSLLLLRENVREKIVLDIYGDGPVLAYLKLFVRLKHLDNNVFFKGFSSNLDSELFKYDVGLNLTKKEGFGRTTVEYMMHGLYVIGCNDGATPELLNNGKYGSLVEYGNSEQIACELENYFDNQKEKKEVAKRAQHYAMKEFSVEKNIETIKSVYKKFIT